MTDEERRKTSEIQMIVDRRIASQAELCAAHLDRVRDQMESTQTDALALSNAVDDLRTQILKLMAQVTALNLKVEAQIESLRQRWKIWPTLKDITLLIVAAASLILALTR